MMDNLKLWNKVREVPSTAQKSIGGGRLKGMTDINPMWRIKKLTEEFGQCGFGWYYNITDKRIEEGGKGEKSAFVDIELFVKVGDEWSKGIQGTGGSSFVANEKSGPYTNDECFKMALTDAISVACKALGFGANIYWSKDNTKYNDQKKENHYNSNRETNELSDSQVKRLNAIAYSKGYGFDKVLKAATKKYGVTNLKKLTKEQYDEMCKGYESLVNKTEQDTGDLFGGQHG